MKRIGLRTARLTFVLALFTALLATPPADAADLIVKIGGLKTSATGSVRVGLFDRAAAFPDKQLRGELVEAKQGIVTAIFKDVPAGTYAISAFQDVNGNKKLDTNAVGRPTEPYGFSRNARGMFGPPSFDAAAFSLREGENIVELDLK